MFAYTGRRQSCAKSLSSVSEKRNRIYSCSRHRAARILFKAYLNELSKWSSSNSRLRRAVLASENKVSLLPCGGIGRAYFGGGMARPDRRRLAEMRVGRLLAAHPPILKSNS